MPGRARLDSAHQRHHGGRRALVAIAAALASLAFAAPASAATDGKVKFVINAKSSFDPILTGSTTAERQWMASHYWRMRGYPPFFNQALGWAPAADFYKDLYALYRDRASDQQLMQDHPNWVLRDASGNRLFIQWNCNGTTCSQYAGDIGSYAFRQYWIDAARMRLDQGYRGLFIDDINLNMRVSDGTGTFTRPIDPRTGAPMTDADWRRYVAEFTEQIRAQLPNAMIGHNTGGWTIPHSDPYLQRQIDAADVIELERGFNDAGRVGGTGPFGYETFLAHIDWLHGRGKSIMLEPYGLDANSAEFEVASYYLVKDLNDAIVSDYLAYPSNWWTGWETDLGAPSGARYAWNGLFRRDFAGGMVLTNQPGATTRTVTLPSGSTWTDLAGNEVTSVTLTARRGKVLFNDGAAPPPPDTTAPETTITSGPSGTIDQASASFGFSSSESGSSFQCRLDAQAFAGCTSPKSYSGLSEGAHTFQVRAAAATGNVDATAASRSFTVDLPGNVTLRPNKHTVKRNGRVALSGSATGGEQVTLEMRLAGSSKRSTWRPVATDASLSDGAYRVRVRMRHRGVFRYRATAAGLNRSRSVRVRVRS